MTSSTTHDISAARRPALVRRSARFSINVRSLRRLGTAAAIGCALALSGCGGGGGDDTGSVSVVQGPALQVDVVAGGTTYAPVPSGQTLDVAVRIGQSVAFDANEPVVWSFSVNGSPLFSNGTTVDLGGVTISQSQFDASAVVLESLFYGPAQVPIVVVLTATSTIDHAQVATIRLVLE